MFLFREVRRSGHSWTFEEEEELRQLYDEFKDSEGKYTYDRMQLDFIIMLWLWGREFLYGRGE